VAWCWSRIGCAGALLVALLCAGCVAVPAQQYALLPAAAGVSSRNSVCSDTAAVDATSATPDDDATAPALDPDKVRIASWNLHKQQDRGWREELERLAELSDILLLQEAALTSELRSALDGARYTWVLASAFAFDGTDYGVAIASRVRPIFFCTGRAFEPLTGIPKSYLVARFRLAGRDPTLAVATIHAINFTLDLEAYDGELDALRDVLAAHRGPIALAGDFNTWSEARERRLDALALRLGLEPVFFEPDRRSRFLGRPADWVFARGASVLGSETREVTASDHNPLLVMLRIR
jgi:endonuclease/exonuclease/phosphatase (EEP) superfamily protein YafD